MKPKFAPLPLAILFLALACLTLARAQPTVALPLWIVPDNATGIYEIGAPVRWTLEWKSAAPAPANATYTIKNGGLTPVATGTLAFRNNTATLDSRIDATAPNTQLLEVKWDTGDTNHTAVAGVVAAPYQIAPAAPPPDDFDTFWKTKLAELATIPANPQLTPADSAKPNVSYWKITMANIRGTHIQGQLARPSPDTTTTEKKFPALLIVQYAGLYPLEKNWVTDRAAEGWLALNISAHDIPIDAPAATYDNLRYGPLKNYWAQGNDNPDTSYYLRMYLSCYRAVQYLKQRPDWNGQTIVVMGASQGGQQTLVTAGLCPDDITAAIAFVPAACDMLAPSIGRATGFPNWYSQTHDNRTPQKVRTASLYYDPINFARRIRCPVLVAAALEDDLAPPSSVLAAFNTIAARKELILLPRAGHFEINGSHRAYYNRVYNDWLPALRQNRPAPVRDTTRWVGTWSASAQTVERDLLPPDTNLANTTLRQIVRTSIGGKQLRVRLSNAFAAPGNALQITAATIALSNNDNTQNTLTFNNGQPAVTIPAGALLLSDPVDFDLPPGADLAITLRTANSPAPLTGHRSARADSYLKNEYGTTTTAKVWLYLCGIDVLAPPDTAAAIFLGDSITDGKGSTEGANRRWPDRLAARLRANPATARTAILNQGIGGNAIVRGGIGQPALARLERDVLAQPGARWLIVFEGINDLGSGKTTAAELIDACRQIITRARDHGLRVYGATITPFGNSFYDKPGIETERQKANAWIRTSLAYDAVLDFDAAVRDPQNPARLLPAADSGDHLHLNDEGYRLLAESIDLNLFNQ